MFIYFSNSTKIVKLVYYCVLCIFGCFNSDDFWLTFNKKKKIHYLNKLEYGAMQSANQLKTTAKVSWAFKMVSQFGSLGYTIMGKTADLTVVQKTNHCPPL